LSTSDNEPLIAYFTKPSGPHIDMIWNAPRRGVEVLQ
jgi:hypothetical protein